MVVVILDSVESTNLYCEALDLEQVEDFTCFCAKEQTAGIGQRGNHWHSDASKSLAFSLVLHPHELSAVHQFRLTEMLSLGVVDCLRRLHPPVEAIIKWPNDIYIGSRKVGGMLVSVRIQDGAVRNAICGIGLNVRQTAFPEWVPNPISLLQAGADAEPLALLPTLLAAIRRRYEQMLRGESLREEYLERLWLRLKPAPYRIEGREVVATLTGVDTIGRLLLKDTEGREYCCGMKEVEFLPLLVGQHR